MVFDLNEIMVLRHLWRYFDCKSYAECIAYCEANGILDKVNDRFNMSRAKEHFGSSFDFNMSE